MKTIKLLLISLATIISAKCTTIVEDDSYNSVNEPKIIEKFDLWYVDYNRTTGTGDIPFLSRAFTLSFFNGQLYANNNLVGVGQTGNGLGIKIGFYDYNRSKIFIQHNIYGNYELDIQQVAFNEIKFYDRFSGLAYYLIGYNRSSFNYDRLFYDNIHYFLQEYNVWEKVYTSNAGNPNPFDAEGYLKFLAGGNDDSFRSSKDFNLSNINNIYWDYNGRYSVHNNGRRLNLYYSTNDFEAFDITVLNDQRISLYHISSGTTYEFIGRGFIQYLKKDKKRSFQKIN